MIALHGIMMIFLSAVGVTQGLIDKYYSCSFIFGGDFNISKSAVTNTHQLLSNLCDKNQWSDPVFNGVDYTYHNESLGNYSPIDYFFLCSPNLIDSTVNNQILDDSENVSDHLAIMCNSVSNRMTADLKMSE